MKKEKPAWEQEKRDKVSKLRTFLIETDLAKEVCFDREAEDWRLELRNRVLFGLLLSNLDLSQSDYERYSGTEVKLYS